MATLLDDELELDEDLLAGAFTPSLEADAAPPPPIDAQPANKDNGARPANAPDSVKQAAQAKAGTGAPAFNLQDFMQRTPEDEADVLAYKSALGQARQGRLAADIGQAGENIASQLLGIKPASGDFWQRQRAEAESPIETLRALSGIKAGQLAQKQKGLAQGLAFQTAQTNALNALTAQKNAADAAEYRKVQTELAKRKLAGQDASADAAKALELPDSPETGAAKEMFEKAHPQEAAALKASGKWATIKGSELGDIKELGKTYRAILSGEASGARQGAAFTQEGVRNEREKKEKLEEEGRKKAEDEKLLYVPGMTREGAKGAIAVDEAKKLRDGLAGKNKLNLIVDRMEELRRQAPNELKAGKLVDTPASLEFKKLQSDAMLAIKAIEAMGTLDQQTQNVAMTMMPAGSELFQANFDSLAKSLRKGAQNAVEAKAAALEYRPETTAATGATQAKPAGPIRVDPKTKERRQWNGKEWVKING